MLKTNTVCNHPPAMGGDEERRMEETKEGKMQIDRGEESSSLLPGLFLARLTGGQ